MGCTASKPTPPPPTPRRSSQSPRKQRSKTPVQSAPGSVSTGEKLARMVVSKAREEEQRANAEKAATTFAERYVTDSSTTSDGEILNKSADLTPVPAQQYSTTIEEEILSYPILTDDIAISVVEPVEEKAETEIVSEQSETEQEIVESASISEIENGVDSASSEHVESIHQSPTVVPHETEVVQSEVAVLEAVVEMQESTPVAEEEEEYTENEGDNELSPSENNVDENFISSKVFL